MIFNFSHYLNVLMPTKRMPMSREDFLTDIYQPIIDKYHLKNKSGGNYEITRELTSSLFTGKSNLPQVLVKAFNKADLKKEEFYEDFKSTLNKLHSYEMLDKITQQLKVDIFKCKPFSTATNEELADVMITGDIYKFHWFLFKVLGEMENRGIGLSYRKQGRPKKNPYRVDFFYLSEEDKHIEFDRMVKSYSKENAKLSLEDFKYFLNAIPYIADSVSEEQKKIILFNFYKAIENNDNYPRTMDMTDYFRTAKRALGCEEIYDKWMALIIAVGIKYEFNVLKTLYKKFLDTGDPYPVLYEMNGHVDNETVLNEKVFRTYFRRKNFLLPPNIFETINEHIWHYCLCMAEFAGKANMCEEFIQYINELRNENENNNTVNTRCNELIKECNRFASSHL